MLATATLKRGSGPKTSSSQRHEYVILIRCTSGIARARAERSDHDTSGGLFLPSTGSSGALPFGRYSGGRQTRQRGESPAKRCLGWAGGGGGGSARAGGAVTAGGVVGGGGKRKGQWEEHASEVQLGV